MLEEVGATPWLDADTERREVARASSNPTGACTALKCSHVTI